MASAWLTSARLARKAGFTHQAFNAVLRASRLGDGSATIEHARLLWKEGQHRKAIQSLEGAIATNAFVASNFFPGEDSMTSMVPDKQQQNMLASRAHLLLAKWLDGAGQTQSDVIVRRYREACQLYGKWDKPHYYLGKHYNKILESEKLKPPIKRAQTFVSGEAVKLVIENYMRALHYGSKYIFQAMPKVLTLWLEQASEVDKPLDPKLGDAEQFVKHTKEQRMKVLENIHHHLRKYIDRLPSFIFYTVLSQAVARILHTNTTVVDILKLIVTKAVSSHPQQGLWTLLAVAKSSDSMRAKRGASWINTLSANAKKKGENSATEMKTLIIQGQKLSDQLLQVCEEHIPEKTAKVSLARDLRFNHKVAPCRLVVPLEATLIANLPTGSGSSVYKGFRAFSKDAVTISVFLDDVMVLPSLQKPRKVTIRGSDGRSYAVLCKPKDDLRKDQRLMEFNTMINRALKRDAEASKRRLYIKTYAVTPLNEECGLIEWVDNLRTFRDIVLQLYKEKNIAVDYKSIVSLLREAETDLSAWTKKLIPSFPPVFHEWFVETFPEPGSWFAARLRYTRSCAVMSMVGHVLGLGDRHGENILFEENNGGTFHVDFNCLFDKGMTFEKPERTPFRLTNNMIDAFGAYGYDGPFRKSCELTMGLLRQNEDTLMTILETFLYDPTTDFIGKPKMKRAHTAVPDTPEGVLDSVRSKLRGLLPGESVPLSVGGHVDHLILQATKVENLAAMYIGWCAYF